MFGVFLLAQMTADYACWANFGTGIVDMSHLCGFGQVVMEAEPFAVGGPSDPEPNAALWSQATFYNLPGVWECAQARSQNSGGGTFDTHLEECAADLGVVATYNSPGGRLEIVEPVRNEGYWVRLPDETRGYGPFDRRSAAYEWAKANYSQFFEM